MFIKGLERQVVEFVGDVWGLKNLVGNIDKGSFIVVLSLSLQEELERSLGTCTHTR